MGEPTPPPEPILSKPGLKLSNFQRAQIRQALPAAEAVKLSPVPQPTESQADSSIITERPVEKAVLEVEISQQQPDVARPKEKQPEKPALTLFDATGGTRLSVSIGEDQRESDRSFSRSRPLTSEGPLMTNIGVPAPDEGDTWPIGTVIDVTTREKVVLGPDAVTQAQHRYFVVGETKQKLPPNSLAVENLTEEQYQLAYRLRSVNKDAPPIIVVRPDDLRSQGEGQKARINARNIGVTQPLRAGGLLSQPNIVSETTSSAASFDVQQQKVPLWAKGLHTIRVHTRFDQAIQDNEIVASTTAARGKEEQARLKEQQRLERLGEAQTALEDKRLAEAGLTRKQVDEYQAEQVRLAAEKTKQQQAEIMKGKIATPREDAGLVDTTGAIQTAQRTMSQERAARVGK